MKKFFITAILSVNAIFSFAQTKIINVYEVATLSKDTITNSFDAYYYPDVIGDTIVVSKRFIINFSDSTFIEYVDADITNQGKIDIITNLSEVTSTFFILLLEPQDQVRGINNFLLFGNCLYFEQYNNITRIEKFEKFSIY
jgi:hypothetical protein